ncbi:putative ABC transport system permease protein [Fictibacillus solisalsi]|uniref:Putative hemin transport system permease protein HrtB n=1 Tax=Fictibacillus solisalsi TaxID=459525 RepID=A0A1G9TV22_9BACL|nr:ABC transporter permease [Fictibacillus solisalsi]SDM51085.1 putative ABC transport system permease protein [Fictibacillus solisalsi]
MFLALREMKHAKMRYVLIGLIMVLISFLVLFVSGLAKGLASDNASSIQTMNADYVVLDKQSDQRINRSQLTDEQLKEILHSTNQKQRTEFGLQMTTVQKNGEAKKTDSTLFAVDPKGFIAPQSIDGQSLKEGNKNEAVGDLSLKDEGFQIGDRLKEETTGTVLTLIGFTENQSFSHSPVLHVSLKTWEAMHDGKQSVNAAALKADSGKAKEIEKLVPGVEVISKNDALKSIPGYKEEQGSLLMMIVFLFVIAAFVLSVFFYVITLQKVNQFGVLKAMGAQSGYLSRTVMYQVLSLTVVSLAISILLTFTVSQLLPASMPFLLNVPLVAGCSVLFLTVSVIGSLISLYQVIKIDATEAIGRAS